MPLYHSHSGYFWQPPDFGLKAFAYDGALVATGAAPADGVMQAVRVHLPVASTITNVVLFVSTAGTTLTSGNNIAGLYTAAGAKVDVTADQTTAWQSGGLKVMPLAAGTYSATAGDYYVTWWINGTGTDPSFSRAVNSSIANMGLTAPNFRFALADTGLTNAASAPANMGTQTVNGNAYWAGLS